MEEALSNSITIITSADHGWSSDTRIVHFFFFPFSPDCKQLYTVVNIYLLRITCFLLLNVECLCFCTNEQFNVMFAVLLFSFLFFVEVQDHITSCLHVVLYLLQILGALLVVNQMLLKRLLAQREGQRYLC